MTFLIAAIARDLGDIPLVGSIPTFFFLGLLVLVCSLAIGLSVVGLKSIVFRDIGGIVPKDLDGVLV